MPFISFQFSQTVVIICICTWWLILYANLTGLRDTKIAGNALFLGVSVRLYQEEFGMWVGGLSKDIPSM